MGFGESGWVNYAAGRAMSRPETRSWSTSRATVYVRRVRVASVVVAVLAAYAASWPPVLRLSDAAVAERERLVVTADAALGAGQCRAVNE